MLESVCAVSSRSVSRYAVTDVRSFHKQKSCLFMIQGRELFVTLNNLPNYDISQG